MEDSCEAMGRYYRDAERGVSHGTSRGDKKLVQYIPGKKDTAGAGNKWEPRRHRKAEGEGLNHKSFPVQEKEKPRCKCVPLEVPWGYGRGLGHDGVGYVPV